jgi:hypothetical protein
MKRVHVKFAGIDSEPYDGTLKIIYIPDQLQTLLPGQKYEIVIDGLTFAEKDTGEVAGD